ncbi:hypothetical protein HDU78_006600 [Chytriomyces hyalinus]|nr:hypothetical protein HDU78_006600 [Chytriomyces hyalinus]
MIARRLLALVALAVQRVSAVANGTSTICDSTNSFCATFSHSPDPTRVTVLVESQFGGWASLGFGSGMSDAKAYFIAWNDGASTIVSQRAPSMGYHMPKVASKQESVPVSLAAYTLRSSTKLAVAFEVPRSYFSSTGPTSLIYAVCSEVPAGVNSVSYHDGPHGTAQFDINTGVASVKAGPPDYIVSHGITMVVAWGVIPYIIIFIARYLKFKMGHAWFLCHAIGGGLFTGGLTVAGVAIMAANIGFKVNGNVHVILGSIMVYGIMPVQILLGIASDRMFDMQRKSIPWWDRAHWWTGRLAVLLSAVVIFLGIIQGQLGTAWIIAFGVWLGVMVLALVGGQLVFGSSHHVSDDEAELVSKHN